MVPFQRWLKENAGRTYGEAIEAYKEIMRRKSRGDATEEIGVQFEYNRYVRDFDMCGTFSRITGVGMGFRRRLFAGSISEICLDITDMSGRI